MGVITELPRAQFFVAKERDIFKTEETIAYQKSLAGRVSAIAWNIISLIIFPIALYRLITLAAKKIAPLAILPAARIYSVKKPDSIIHLDQARERFLANPNNHATQITVKAADGVDLDTVVIEHHLQKDLPASEQKWVLFLGGNSMCYEQLLEEMKIISNRTGASVYVGNYRGVFRSKGECSSSPELVVDVEAMVQHLLQKGIKPNNVLVHGWSLGGAVGTEVAAYHQEPGREMPLCSDRSFSTLTNFLKARIIKIFAVALGTLLSSAGWLFDGVKNFQKINAYKFVIYSPVDGVILHPAGVYKCLKVLNMAPQNKIKLIVKSEMSKQELIKQVGLQVHGTPITQTGNAFDLYVQQVKSALRIP